MTAPSSVPDRRLVAASLAADRFVWLFLAVIAAELAVYLTPVVSPHQRELFGASSFQIPFEMITAWAAFAGVGRLASREERRFWHLLGAGFLCWLAALLLFVTRPEGPWIPVMSVANDLAYVVGYLMILLAIQRRPYLGEAATPIDVDRRLRAVGVVCFAGGWFAYFVLAPVVLDSAFYGSMAPSYYLFLTLDLVVVAQAAGVARRCLVRRWRAVYLMLAIAASLSFLVDLVDAALTAGVIHLADGAIFDLIWAVPPLAYLLTARMRDVPLAGAEAVDGVTRPARFAPAPVRTGSLLLAGACTFPLVHMWLYATYDTKPALEFAHGVIALAALGLMGGLAVVAYVALARRYGALERARVAAEATVRESQRIESIGRLAGGVAHDFNNLLTVMVGYGDLAIETLAPDDPDRRHLEEVRTATERATALTRQLLAFSRQQVLNAEWLDLNQVVSKAEQMLGRLIGEDIAVDVRLAPEPCPVIADASQIESVLLNLAVNARDAMPDGGRIMITTTNVAVPATPGHGGEETPPGGYVDLVVRDTGEGIPLDARPHVFEPFFSKKAGDPRTGLGLAAVYGIVTQSGGTISAGGESGQGAAFTIRLPRATSAEPPAPQAAEPPARSVHGTVLIAEAEPQVRELARRLLEGSGYTVIVAASGTEALAASAAHAGQVDLLLADVVMPDMTSPALARRLVDERPDLQVLYMVDDEVVTTPVFAVNSKTIIRKPFTRAALAAGVRAALDRRAHAAGTPGPVTITGRPPS